MLTKPYTAVGVPIQGVVTRVEPAADEPPCRRRGLEIDNGVPGLRPVDVPGGLDGISKGYQDANVIEVGVQDFRENLSRFVVGQNSFFQSPAQHGRGDPVVGLTGNDRGQHFVNAVSPFLAQGSDLPRKRLGFGTFNCLL